MVTLTVVVVKKFLKILDSQEYFESPLHIERLVEDPFDALACSGIFNSSQKMIEGNF